MVLFVASPITDSEAELVALGKQLRKNSVALDVLLVGEHEQNESLAQAFVQAADKDGNSHLLLCPPSSDDFSISGLLQNSHLGFGAIGGGAAAGGDAGGAGAMAGAAGGGPGAAGGGPGDEMAAAMQASLAATQQAADAELEAALRASA